MAQVLLIEDDQGILMVGQRVLEAMGHIVITAEDAASALKAFTSNHFDLVITDLKIPGQNGLSTVAKMRKLKTDQPIIVTSGSDLKCEEFLTEVEKVGGALMLSKPFDLVNFMDAVKEGLGEPD